MDMFLDPVNGINDRNFDLISRFSRATQESIITRQLLHIRL
jgi:hypothetical protein